MKSLQEGPPQKEPASALEKKRATTRSYEQHAAILASKYDRIAPRSADIDEVFALIPRENPHTLEIGSGGGRDAEEILKRTKNYIGVDISNEMASIAKERNPEGTFIVADIEEYSFPQGLDAIIAFASLIHAPKEKLQKILGDGLGALNPNGVFRLSLKEADDYRETTTQDEFGTRTFYLYSEKDIAEISQGYMMLKSELRTSQGQTWLEVLLRKPNE